MKTFKNAYSNKIYYNNVGQISISSCLITNKFKKFYDYMIKTELVISIKYSEINI